LLTSPYVFLLKKELNSDERCLGAFFILNVQPCQSASYPPY
jgi:hypothetical protein